MAALGVATREFVQIADAYSGMTARLKLATKATGDFEQVQQALRKAADETRAPLQDTVNLYSQVAPSLLRLSHRWGLTRPGIDAVLAKMQDREARAASNQAAPAR